MKTHTSKITMVAGLIAVSLAGLAVVQMLLLDRALTSEEDAFQRNVAVALHRVGQSLSTREIMSVLIESDIIDSGAHGTTDSIQAWIGSFPDSTPDALRQMHMSMDKFEVTSQYFGDSLDIVKTDGQRTLHYRMLPNGDTVLCETLQVKCVDSIQRQLVMHNTSEWQSGYSYQTFFEDSMATAIVAPRYAFGDSSRNYLVRFVLSRLESREVRPLANRVDSSLLDSLIRTSLLEADIDLDYQFAVVDVVPDSLAFVSPASDTDALRSSPHRSRLFPQDVLGQPTDLVVDFPGKTGYIWAQMLPIAGPAGLFLVLIAFGFVYTVRLLMHQQMMARRLTDFINNMTHEFKTPIATIRLATEALQRPEVQADSRRVDQFNRMILEENRRMTMQVDKILQMSVLEDRHVELQKTEVDMHALIQQAVAAMQLPVESRQGTIDKRLEASVSIVTGDPVHLANVVYSLLDNANKYSPNEPTIRIETSSDDTMLTVRIADRGIGIAPEDQTQVFDRYFRVSTGDRHDVKGFGLGLTYVKAVVEAHGGNIHLASSLGAGTEMSIRLPLSRISES